MLTCKHRSRIAGEPVTVEPAAVPDPTITVPAEATDVEIAIGRAVNGSPEEDVASVPVFIFFPRISNEVRILQEVVTNIGVQDRLVGKFLAEIVAFDASTFLLLRQVELNLLAVEVEAVAFAFEFGNFALLVFFHLPTVRQEGIGTKVDGVLHGFDFVDATQCPFDLGKETLLFAKDFDVLIVQTFTTAREFEFVCLTNI